MFNCIVFKYKIEVNGFLRKKNRFYFREELENLIANFRIFFFCYIYLSRQRCVACGDLSYLTRD